MTKATLNRLKRELKNETTSYISLSVRDARAILEEIERLQHLKGIAHKVCDLRQMGWNDKTRSENHKLGFDSACYYVLCLLNGAEMEDFTREKQMQKIQDEYNAL